MFIIIGVKNIFSSLGFTRIGFQGSTDMGHLIIVLGHYMVNQIRGLVVFGVPRVPWISGTDWKKNLTVSDRDNDPRSTLCGHLDVSIEAK